MAPRDESEMARMIEFSLTLHSPVAIRYPRGNGSGKRSSNRLVPLKNFSGEMMLEGKSKIMVIGIGLMTVFAFLPVRHRLFRRQYHPSRLFQQALSVQAR